MKQLFKILFAFVMTSASLLAIGSKGTMSVLLFSNGKPLVSNEVKIDGKKSFMTDKDGALSVTLATGKHQIEIFGKDANGIALGYFKKTILIKEARDTEVIATLSKKGRDTIDVDIPVDITAAKESKSKKVEGTGTIQGTVLSSEGGTGIVGARVFVRGTSIDIRTDANGHFTARIPSGIQLSISVVHSSYSAQTISNVRVKKDGIIRRTIKLTPASMDLEEFVVLAPKVEGSLSDVINEEKKMSAIGNIIGSEEFSKKGDSSAASALKRVAGVTLVGGKSIYVRGLGERYSNVELNSLPLPSPDPTKRVVPLDIFPASMIGSMKVQKSGTADVPASFGGGYIDMRTKNKHEDDYIQIGFGLKGNIYTGKEVITHTGSSSDWTGFDNGYRNIPTDILRHAEVVVGEPINVFSRASVGNGNIAAGEARLLQMTKDFVYRNYSVLHEPLPLGGTFDIEALKNFEIDEENKISVFSNYSYSQEHTYREENFFNFLYDIHSKPVSLIAEGILRIAESEYTQSAILNVDYMFSDVLHLKYTKLFTHVGEKSTRENEGVFGSNFEYQYYTFLDWSERTLTTDQLSGDLDYELFNIKNTLNFGVEHASARFNQPNNILMQDVRVGATPAEYERRYFAGGQNFLSQKILSEDNVFALNVDNKIEYELFSDEDYVQVGLSYSNKDRISQNQRFFLDRKGGSSIPDYTDLPGGNPEHLLDIFVRNETNYDNLPFVIASLFDSSDFFDAEILETDAFINTFVKPYDNLEVMTGVRYVNLAQNLFEYIEDRQDDRRITIRENNIFVNDFFPSTSVKYKHDDDNIFDFAFSKTFITPDLREFSEALFFHPYEVAVIRGNPDLNNTLIYSVDFKYSHFFTQSEYVKAGVFYKYMDKPIEDTELVSSSLPIFSYMNSDFATLYGIELDARKNLDFLGSSVDATIKPYLGNISNYYVSSNFSFTESEVSLQEAQIPLLTTNHRQLQGLSRTVFNATLGYDIEGRSVTLSYNHMGERIRRVGLVNVQGVRFGDTIEIPPKLLDFVWIEKFDNGFIGKVKIGNILDYQTVWIRDKKELRNFRTRQTIDFKVSYKF